MEALLRGEWGGTDSAPATLRTQASGLVAAHLQWHLERQLRPSPLIARSRPHAAAAGGLPLRKEGTRDSTTRTANSARAQERRVGNECGSTYRNRWSQNS